MPKNLEEMTVLELLAEKARALKEAHEIGAVPGPPDKSLLKLTPEKWAEAQARAKQYQEPSERTMKAMAAGIMQLRGRIRTRRNAIASQSTAIKPRVPKRKPR